MKKTMICWWVCLACLLLQACEPGAADTSPPDVAEVLQPQAGEVFVAGDSMPVSIVLSDDVDLESYVVGLRSLFGHSWLWAADTQWRRGIDGQAADVSFRFPLAPALRNGPYECYVACADNAMNRSDTLRLNLQIVNLADTVPPSANIFSPSAQDTVVTFAGNSLVFAGNAADNERLGELQLLLFDEAGGLAAEPLYRNLGDAGNFTAIGEVLGLPAEPGIYTARLTVTDYYNNGVEMEFALRLL